MYFYAVDRPAPKCIYYICVFYNILLPTITVRKAALSAAFNVGFSADSAAAQSAAFTTHSVSQHHQASLTSNELNVEC